MQPFPPSVVSHCTFIEAVEPRMLLSAALPDMGLPLPAPESTGGAPRSSASVKAATSATTPAVADTVLNFEGEPAVVTPIGGTYKGVDFGSTGTDGWSANLWKGSESLTINSAATGSKAESFTLPSGTLLKALTMQSDSGAAIVKLSSPGNPDVTFNKVPTGYTAFVTGWTNASPLVTVSVTSSNGAEDVDIRDLTYGAATSTTPPAGTGTGSGLTGQYYNDASFGTPVVTRTDPTVNFSFGTASPAPGVNGQTFSVRWTGQIQPLHSDTYTFYLKSEGADQLLINGQQVISDLYTHNASNEASGSFGLIAGQKYNIQVDFFQMGAAAADQLSWSSVSQPKQIIPTSQLYPTTPVTFNGEHGVPIGAGSADGSVHQIVRTSGNVVYVFANGSTTYPSNAGSQLHVYRASQTGTPTSFAEVDAAHAPGGEVNTVDAAIDGNDVVHVVWNNRLGQVNYATFDTRTDTWSATRLLANNNWTDFSQGDEGVALALDAAGNSHVVWSYKDGGGALHLNYANNIGGNWSAPARVDDATIKNAWHPTLAFAPNGDLLLAWIDGTGNYSPDGVVRTRLRHANGAWDASLAINDSAYAGLDNSPSLLITADGTQNITFNNNHNEIQYWYNTGSGWQGDRQPAVQETHDPVLGPDGHGGLYIYGHGAPADGSQAGFGPDKFRFHLPAGAKTWSPYTRYTTGPFDDSTNSRWSQFFYNYPSEIDSLYWYDNYSGAGSTTVPYTLYLNTDTTAGDNTLPTGWSDVDINSPANKGSAAFDGTTWTIAGGGSDIWNNADQLNFASEPVAGDQTMTAEVTGISNTNTWAKAGVMLRDSNAPGSINAAIVATPGQGVSFQWRSTTGGASYNVRVAGIAAPTAAKPVWVRLIKSGSKISAFYSLDGTNYLQLGATQSLNFSNANYQAGLAVTAHTNSALNTATFTNVVVAATAPTSTTTSLFTTQTPDNPAANDGVSYELGTKFQSSVGGAIEAIRYYKSPGETGTHVGHLWDAAGNLLGTATFTNETASGWQTAYLPTPITILSHTTYVTSVNANTLFADTHNGLSNSVSNGSLGTVADGNDGVFGPPGSFPTRSFQNSNYFRDVVFIPRQP